MSSKVSRPGPEPETSPPQDPPRGEGPEEAAIQPILGDLLSRAVRRLVHRSRAELGRAARTGRQKLAERQLQRDLDHFWMRLGKSAYHLVHAGELDHPALRKAMTRIDDLERQLDALRSASPAEPETDPSADLAPPRGDD